MHLLCGLISILAIFACSDLISTIDGLFVLVTKEVKQRLDIVSL